MKPSIIRRDGIYTVRIGRHVIYSGRRRSAAYAAAWLVGGGS